MYGEGDHVDHAQLDWPEGGGMMMGSHKPDGEWTTEPGTAGFYVVTADPQAVHDRAEAAGAEITRELNATDYGSTEFGLRDPEGNQWSFGTYAGRPRTPDRGLRPRRPSALVRMAPWGGGAVGHRPLALDRRPCGRGRRRDLLVGGCSTDEPAARGPRPAPPTTPTPSTNPLPQANRAGSRALPPVEDKVSLPALMREDFSGGRIRRGPRGAGQRRVHPQRGDLPQRRRHRLRRAAASPRARGRSRRWCSTTATSSRRSTSPARA